VPLGDCHRFPPVPDYNLNMAIEVRRGYFPEVYATDWCGEHQTTVQVVFFSPPEESPQPPEQPAE
jgi:hypothetical protein